MCPFSRRSSAELVPAMTSPSPQTIWPVFGSTPPINVGFDIPGGEPAGIALGVGHCVIVIRLIEDQNSSPLFASNALSAEASAPLRTGAPFLLVTSTCFFIPVEGGRFACSAI